MLKKFFLTASIALAILIPSVTKIAHAQDSAVAKGLPYWGPILSCEGSPEQVQKAQDAGAKITKVCSNLCDLFATAQNGIYFILTLLLFVAVPLSLVVGGLMMIIGGATPKIAQQGKNIVFTTIGGAALALCAFVIVNTFLFLLSISTTDPEGKAGIAWGNIHCNVPAAQNLQQTPSGGSGGGNPTDVITCKPEDCFGGCPSGQTCKKTGSGGTCGCVATNSCTGCDGKPITYDPTGAKPAECIRKDEGKCNVCGDPSKVICGALGTDGKTTCPGGCLNLQERCIKNADTYKCQPDPAIECRQNCGTNNSGKCLYFGKSQGCSAIQSDSYYTQPCSITRTGCASDRNVCTCQ